MKTKVLKFILAMAILGVVSVFGVKENSITVYAAGDTTEAADDSSNQDGDTLESGDVKDIDDMSVKMDQNGKMTTSFDDQSDSTKTWNTVFKKYRVVVVGISGLLTLTFIILFLVNFFKIGAASDNPTERRKVLHGLLWMGIAAAGSGSVTLICALFWNALK